MSAFLRKILKFVSTSPSTSTTRPSTTRHPHRRFGTRPLTYLTDDEMAIQQSVAKLAQQEIAPHVRAMESAGCLKASVVDSLFKNGLMAIEVDPQYGGSGLNFTSTILCIEELSKVDAGVGGLIEVHNVLINSVIEKLGTPAQKNELLPQLGTRLTASFALTEHSSGSDAWAMKTTARKLGTDYVLNGTKQFITNAASAGLFLVMANAAPETGYKGITCFLLDRDTPGFSVGPQERHLGLQSGGNCPLVLEDVRVPADRILGGLGRGYQLAAAVLNQGRIGIGAQMVGLAQGCLEATLPYIMAREQFGQPIYRFQGVQHQVARIVTEVEAARLLVYNAARLVEGQRSFVKEASMAKWYAADVAQRVTVQCIDWMGGVGFSKEFPQEKFYRDVKAGSIYEGTYNVQLNTIAKCVEKEYQ